MTVTAETCSASSWTAPTPEVARSAKGWWTALRPPPRLTVSEWADRYRQLSAEDSAEPGQWATNRAEYLRGIMDALNDPSVQEIVLVKSAQVGGTACLMNILGYFIDQDAAPIMWVTVSLGEAEVFSRDRFEPFRRDNPRIAARIGDPRSRDSGNTILNKLFKGGRLLFRGANSAPSLRSHPIRVVIMDEVDGYPATTSEGEPTKLAKKRTTAFWNRKIIQCSTPGERKTSRICAAYEKSDKRRFHVRCPHCDEEQPLAWGGPATPFGVKWGRDPGGEARPETARYLCRNETCGTLWSDIERWDAVAKGRWVAEGEPGPVAGFYINELYSPFKLLAETAAEFLDAKDDPAKLKEWQQQAMAEPWEERGEAPDWEMLYRRREPFRMGTVPAKACLLTAGVDTQDDRLEFGLFGWDRRKNSYLVDYRVIRGDTRESGPWEELAELLAKDWPHASGVTLPIRVMCIDRGGHRAHMVDTFAARHPQAAHGPAGVVARRPRTVVATVGRDEWKSRVLGVSTLDGKKRRRSAIVVTLGSSYLKSEITTWLRQPWPTDEAIVSLQADYPVGAHHVSTEVGETYFRQLCAEQLVTHRVDGVVRQAFKPVGNDRNEALDVFVLGRAAAHMVGVDHFRESEWRKWEEAAGYPAAMLAAPSSAPAKDSAPPSPAELAPPSAAKVNRTTGRARGGFWAGRR